MTPQEAIQEPSLSHQQVREQRPPLSSQSAEPLTTVLIPFDGDLTTNT